MVQGLPSASDSERDSGEFMWADGERIFRRGSRPGMNGEKRTALFVQPVAEHPSRSIVDRLSHEYELRDELDGAWAARPLDLVREAGRTTLVLEDANDQPLERLLGQPMELARFLDLAISVAAAVSRVHEQSLVHRDIKPTNILVNLANGGVRLTGFGIASRLIRERRSPQPPETIAGTLAYMAPEQTGRMNRSIDSRSDLYALGITFYQMLTGALPYTAADPMEWVHCHLARKPVPPAERVRSIPGVVSAIIMKLLAKMAEDRYQTASGLESDLRRCLAEWNAQRKIDTFPLGERDTPRRLLVPEKLYGRQREVDSLLAAFDRVVKDGSPELVLVSGHSGIGKSSVVNELQPVLVTSRGLFARGKFDQNRRDIPYSTIAQAFQGLVRSLLAKSDTELRAWREAFREALGPNGQLMVDLVPELKLVIGEQGPPPELPPQDAQRRFHRIFRRFMGVFGRPEHPLALFLDDLQWLDAATLDLLEDLLIHPDVRHVLLIGAYRENEVTAAHPLMRKVEALRPTGKVHDIKLHPLAGKDVDQLVADSLRCDAEQAVSLASLVHARTEGNPFFVIQFLHVLADEGLLAFDYRQGLWIFDLGRIHAKGYTDNVIDLMAGKLTRLPMRTQEALRQLACFGSVADVEKLSMVLGSPEDEVHAALWEALHQQLIEGVERSYRFAHDRVQEAAYALIPEQSRAEAHLKIGRLLLTQTSPEQRDQAIFEIVNQLNRGAPLITLPEEREQLAELNLAAGKRAKASSAYVSALRYIAAGAALLPRDAWDRRQELAFELELHAADCEVCAAELQAARQRLTALATRAVGPVQRCLVARRLVDLYTMLGDGDRAVAVALDCLRHVGIDWPAHPEDVEVRREYDRIWSLLGSRAIEDLVDLPQMRDPLALATLGVLTSLSVPALYTDDNLVVLSICRAANLNLERGNSDAAASNYEELGMIASARFGHCDQGYRFGRTGCDLLERRGWNHRAGRTYNIFAVLVPWTRPLAEAVAPARRSLQTAKENGDPTFAAFALRDLTFILLALGHPLDQLEREVEESLEFARRFGSFLDRVSAPLALVRTLRGTTAKFGSLDDGAFSERSFEKAVTGHPARAFLECYYWIRKLQARFLAGDYAAAIQAAEKVDAWYASSATLSLFMLQEVEYHFYAALARAARCEPAGPDPYETHREALRRDERQLRDRAARCPQNFADRAALIGAEIARIEGRPLDAQDLYERAIAAARASDFVHNEALAYELAAGFYAARGFDEIAHLYLANARRAYRRWGADGKVLQLEQLHPWLRQEEPAAAPTGTIDTPVEQLDLAAVIEVSQALSGEMVPEKLVDKLMRAAIEHAGAERGLLISLQGDALRIAAEATARGEDVAVHLPEHAGDVVAALPESVVRYAMRTREAVILDDASSSRSAFNADAYIIARRARSILCLPLINQGKLIGILYIENNLARRVFTPARIATLKVIASQAAISLENTRLYRDLANREGKIRRLVDANIIGIFVADREGRIVEANDAFLRILGYDREDLVSGRVRWTELSPPEWHERDMRTQAELNSTGIVHPFEKEYFRKDGGRVPVLIGAALFERGGNEGVAFVLDLSERKRAEEAVKWSEESFRAIVETTPECVKLVARDGTVLLTNAAGAEMAGAPSADAVVGQRFFDFVAPEHQKQYREFHERVCAGQRGFLEFDLVNPQGVRRHMETHAAPLRTSDGSIVQLGVTRDVTARKRAIEALRESEQNLRSVIDGIPGFVAVLAPNGDVEAINHQIVEYCGETLERLKQWAVNGIIYPEDLPHLAEVFGKSIAAGIAYQFEARLRRFDGQYRWFDIRGIPVRDASGGVSRWYVLLTDIDDRTQALTRLQQMQSDFAHMNRVSIMGELAASLSHEITQPIASARNNARAAMNFLNTGPPGLDEVREALDCVVNDADRAGSIISRIRDQIRKAPPRKDRFDLNVAISEVIVLARSAIIRNGVSVRTQLADQLSYVHADRVQVQQVVLNLVLNAVEAMGTVDTGVRELLISTEQDQTGALVAVRDSGPGIDPKHLERLFEAFYTTKSSGTGMGLSICRSIIGAHGGRLWADANEPRGAVFQFTLPGAEAS
jgi:PAS domain S-box-containing protein